MIGSFGGEGGGFLLLFGRVEDHLNRRIKMKAKMLKTKGCSNKGSSFGPKNCKKCDIFFCLSQASICLSSWGYCPLLYWIYCPTASMAEPLLEHRGGLFFLKIYLK